MKITSEQFLELIENIQKSVEWVSYLNCGGCGVFAALVAKRLNRIGIPAVVRIGAYNGEGNLAVKKTLKKNKRPNQMDFRNNGVSFDHLIVEIPFNNNIYHLDSDHFHLAKPYTTNFNAPIYPGQLDSATALRVAKSKFWNHQFNRGQIPNMIRSLNHVFNEFIKTNA